jgi:Domain of unknown function (DUF4399)
MKRVFFGIFLSAGLAGLAACSSEPAPPASTTAAPAAAPAAAAPASTTPRVFFTSPANGATVKTPVKLVFGLENYTLAAVPAGDVTESRANTGHHHVGVDTDCLPPGTVIPKAAPWVHFGNGSNEIDMQLTPGPHKLALEIGDDKHTTIAGLCTTITVNVTE